MKQRNINTPFVFRLGIVLLGILFMSSYMISGIYARYTTSMSGSANTKVASFDVDANCAYDSATDKYILTIVNDSEVTVSYTVSFMVDGANLPNGVTITFGNIGNSGILTQGASISNALNFSENFSSHHEDLVIDVVLNISQVD